jgi:hypothetical protein
LAIDHGDSAGGRSDGGHFFAKAMRLMRQHFNSCGSCLCVLRQRSVFGVCVEWALRAHVNLFVYLFLGI